uniref:transmembrane protein 107-like isoform X1 n=1 Tax=Myxine glutinosa TaxID=7769 RepID=UPI00358FF4B6
MVSSFLLWAAARTFSLVVCPMPVEICVSFFLFEVFRLPQMKQSFLMSNPLVSLLMSLEGSVEMDSDVHGCCSVSVDWHLGKFDLLEDNVLASLPLEHKQEEFHRVDSQLTVGLWLSMALLSIELLGFFIGASMFHMSQSLLSLCAHTCASISLSLFVTRSWDSCTFWFIFAFCSAFPATTELFLLASTLSKKKIL